MEDGQTLFDYNVGLNDIVQLLIRSQTEPPDSPAPKDSSGVACTSAPSTDPKSESHNSPAPASPAAMETNIDNDSSSGGGAAVTISTVNETKPDTSTTSNSANTKNGFKSSSPAQDEQPPTSSRNALTDPGIGVYKVRRAFPCSFFYAAACQSCVRRRPVALLCSSTSPWHDAAFHSERPESACVFQSKCFQALLKSVQV